MPRVYIFVIYIFIPLKRCQPNVFNQSSSNCKSCVRTRFTNSHSTGSTLVRNRYATAQVGVAYFKWPGYIQSNTAIIPTVCGSRNEPQIHCSTQGNLSFPTESPGVCLVDSVGNNTTLLLVLGFWARPLSVTEQGLSEWETMVHMPYIFLLADTLLNNQKETGPRVNTPLHLEYFYGKLRLNTIVLLNCSFRIW